MTQRSISPLPADHARHDRALVARAAMDDLYEGDAAEARALLERCADCQALATDLRAIARATAHDLPVPRRTRDFRLSPEDAARARGSMLGRFFAGLAAPRYRVLQPLAGAAMVLGLVLVAVGTGGPGAPASLPAADGAGQYSTEGGPGTDAPELAAAGASAAASAEAAGMEAFASPGSTDESRGSVDTPARTAGAPETFGGQAAPESSEALPEATGSTGSAEPAAPSAAASAAAPPSAAAPRAAPPKPTTAAAGGQGPAGDAAGSPAPEDEDTTRERLEGLESAATPGPSPLLVSGLALALAGGLVLTLLWIARRSRSDPLLR